MNSFFPPPFGGFAPGGHRPPGFGGRGHRRGGHRGFGDLVRAQHPGPGFGPGVGPGFGPGFGFGPGGFGFGPGPRGGRRGGGRGRRGDVRAAILLLLAERPMHGYEMIQQIAERSQELWRPSPGSVYPTLQLLTDEGLITGADSDGSKRLFTLTDEGRDAAAAIATAPWEAITEGADPTQMSLRNAVGQLLGAVAQGAHAAGDDQRQRILEVLNAARRDIYAILGESD